MAIKHIFLDIDGVLAALGKIQWLFQHFPELAARCCLTTDKTSFAHLDTLLLDDTPDVAKAFNKAGGRAIVIPQPGIIGQPRTGVPRLRKCWIC